MFRALLVQVAIVLASSIGWMTGAEAANDPDRDWFTLESDHFAVHYYADPDGSGEDFARRVVAYAEEAYETINPLLGWVPTERVEVVCLDQGDAANGFALVKPYDSITLYAHPPTADGPLSDHSDWLRLLIFHEYAHVVHLSNARGLPGWINGVLGDAIKPNESSPRWLAEGVAVWVESLTGAGRLHASRVDMVLRTAAQGGTLLGLSQLSGSALAWPRGSAPYVYGAYIIDRLVQERGVDTLRRFIDAYGRRVMPYGLNIIGRRVTGMDFEQWHSAFVTELRAHAKRTEARVQGAGVVEGQRRTIGGDVTRHPRFSPDGRHLLWRDSDGRDREQIRIAPSDNLDQSRSLLACDGGCGRFVISRDGSDLMLVTGRPYRHVNRYATLVRVALGSETMRGARVLTPRGRAQEPSLQADGRSVWVTRNRWGRTWLEALDPNTGERRDRWDAPGFGRVNSPTPSADGRRVFFSMHAGGNRDLYVLDTVTRRVERLSYGAALEIDLSLSPDGRWLLYASDANGIYNIYAYPVDGGPCRQLTNVLTGAFEPVLSPDGQTLVYVGWHAEGQDLYSMPFKPESAPILHLLDPRPARAESTPRQQLPSLSAYDPWSTLFPRQWFPSFQADSVGPSLLGLEITGQDISGRWSTSLAAEWDFVRRDLTVSMGLDIGSFVPDLSVTLGRYSWDRFAFIGDTNVDYREEVWFAGLELSLTLPDPFSTLAFGMRYTADYVRRLDGEPLRHTPDELTAFIPHEGFEPSLRLWWSFNNERSYARSISLEQGVSGYVGILLRSPWLGSEATSFNLDYRLRAFIECPWADNHVLALRLAGAFAGGDHGHVTGYNLGGVPTQSILSDLLAQTGFGSAWLRGFEPGAFSGRAYQLASVEYRLPLWQVRRGPDTLPVFIEHLSAAVFSDWGVAYTEALGLEVLRDSKVSLGIELRLETELLFGVPQTFRLGYAHGFGAWGIDQVYVLMAAAP